MSGKDSKIEQKALADEDLIKKTGKIFNTLLEGHLKPLKLTFSGSLIELIDTNSNLTKLVLKKEEEIQYLKEKITILEANLNLLKTKK